MELKHADPGGVQGPQAGAPDLTNRVVAASTGRNSAPTSHPAHVSLDRATRTARVLRAKRVSCMRHAATMLACSAKRPHCSRSLQADRERQLHHEIRGVHDASCRSTSCGHDSSQAAWIQRQRPWPRVGRIHDEVLPTEHPGKASLAAKGAQTTAGKAPNWDLHNSTCGLNRHPGARAACNIVSQTVHRQTSNNRLQF
jgi:hypothetical protein